MTIALNERHFEGGGQYGPRAARVGGGLFEHR